MTRPFRDSFTSIEYFRTRGAAAYHAVYVDGEPRLHRDGSDDDFDFGRALHTLVLEPGKWDRRVAVEGEGNVLPLADLAAVTRASGMAWLSRSDAALVRAAATAALGDPVAAPWLTNVKPEVWLEWTDSVSQLPLCAKLDAVGSLDGFVVDIKTCSDPSPASFAKAVANKGYHRQAALYRQAVRYTRGAWPRFLWVAVGKQPPHTVAVYEPSPSVLSLAVAQLDRALKAIAECRQTGSWKDDWQRGVTKLDVPRWAHYEV